MVENAEMKGQADVMRDKSGKALICGYLEKTPEGYCCNSLEKNLEVSLKQAENCPLIESRSRACEVLKPIQNQP